MSFLRRLLYLIYTLLGLEAARLNLRVRQRGLLFHAWRNPMAKIGDTLTATIKPVNAKGDSAPVTEIVWTVSANYDIHVASDSLTAIVVANAAGTGATVSVTAKSKAGVALSGSAALPDVDAVPVDDEAVTLNLTVA